MATWEECNQPIEKIIPPKSPSSGASGMDVVTIEHIIDEEEGRIIGLKNAAELADALDAISEDPTKAASYAFLVRVGDGNWSVFNATPANGGADTESGDHGFDIGIQNSGSPLASLSKTGDQETVYSFRGQEFTRSQIQPDGSVIFEDSDSGGDPPVV